MKIIHDAEGNQVGTVTSNHGFLKFIGVFLGIGLAVEVFFSGNVAGILAFVAVVVIVCVGKAIKHSREQESEDG